MNAVQTRDSSGVFVAGSYVLTVPAAITLTDNVEPDPSHPTRRAQSPRRTAAQLSLTLEA